MSFLAFGGEMGFFVPSESSSKEGQLGTYDSTFARCSMEANSTVGYNESVGFTATDDIWIHFELSQHGSSLSTSTKQPLLVLLDDSDAAQFRIVADYTLTGATNWQLQFNNAGSWGNLGASFATTVARQTVDIHIVGGSASGSFTIYIAGTNRRTSGTVDFSANGSISKIRGYGGNHTTSLSQVIVADEPTIGMRLGTIVMTGQGTTHTFTTGGFANIDEAIYSDADFIQSDTANQVELFTGTSVPSFSGYTIRALGIYARAKQSGTGPTKLRICLRSGGTTYDNGADISLDFAYGAVGAVWETNPATSAAFQSSEIAALEYGVKSIA